MVHIQQRYCDSCWTRYQEFSGLLDSGYGGGMRGELFQGYKFLLDRIETLETMVNDLLLAHLKEKYNKLT